MMTPTATEKKYAEPDADAAVTANERSASDRDEKKDARIPHLNIDDIDKKAVPFLTEVKGKETPFLYHPLKTDGIVYADLFFDIGQATDDELFDVSILSSLLGNIATQDTDGKTLQTKLGLYTGSLSMSGSVSSYDNRVISSAVLRFKALADNYAQAASLAEEILTKTVFDSRKTICDLIDQMVTELQLGFINNSSQIAAIRAAATHNTRDAILDKTGGISFYQRLKALKEKLNSDPESFTGLKARLETAYEKFIRNGRAVFSLACDKESYEKIKDIPLPMQSVLTDTLRQAESTLLSGNIALCAPCDIVFNGYSFNADNDISGGALLLAKKILSLEYLWQKIRVENGAYGCGTIPNSAKRLDMWSYRDPQIGITMNTFRHAGEFLTSLQLSDRALEDYIISVVRSLDNPQLPRATAYLSSVYHLLGRDNAAIQKERDELLSTTLGDLNAIGDKLNNYAEKTAFCTVGSAENIEANRNLYDDILKL